MLLHWLIRPSLKPNKFKRVCVLLEKHCYKPVFLDIKRLKKEKNPTTKQRKTSKLQYHTIGDSMGKEAEDNE